MSAYREPGETYPRWEYKTVKTSGPEADSVANEFGADGWELVSAAWNEITYRLFFKRMK